MSLDILHIIKRILLSDQTVSVPGLGVFYLKRISAQVDKIRHQFYPPSSEIQFKLKPETRGERLIQALIDEFGLDKQAALQTIGTYTEGLRDRIEADEKVELNGLGCLYKDINANLIFDGEEADPVFVSNAYPSFTLDPVVRKNKNDLILDEHSLVGTTVLTKEERSSGFSFQRIIPVLLIGVAMGVIFGLYSWNKKKTSTPTVELMSIDENRLNKRPNTDSQTVDTDAGEIILHDDTPTGASTHQDEILNTDEVVEGRTKDESTESIENSSNNKEETSTDHLTANDRTMEWPNQSSDCVIIVGAFGHTTNVERMITRIEALGWSGYQDQTSRLTRVGVYVDCTSVQGALRQVKSKIEPAAWVLE